MSKIERVVQGIGDLDQRAMAAARERLDQLTKPPGSLGVLEELAVQLAGISGNPMPAVRDKVVIVMAGDHGVVEEGVSAFPSEVTPQMVYNFIRGGAAINVLARQAEARVIVVDLGVAAEVNHPGLINRKVRYGTGNIAWEPAMSREEAVRAVVAGIEVAEEEIKNGAEILATGDMGIGNTTPSSAILAAFSGLPVPRVVGRGTGVDDHRLELKVRAIARALELHRPDPRDPLDVLSKVGGLEIAGLAGVILGAAAARRPVVIDGFISGAAALVAGRMEPKAIKYMIASHVSQEPGHRIIMEMLDLKPMLQMKMRLGEGTGAALAFHLIEAATRIIHEMATFADAGVSGALDA